MECDSYGESEASINNVILEDCELELEFEHNRHGVHYGPGLHIFHVKRRM